MFDTFNKDIPDSSQLPAITQSELNEALEKHKMYLCGQIGGRRAVFQYKNLSHLNFYNHDLSQADFTGSALSHADLSFGVYRGACFFGCDLRDADLSETDLSRTDLRGANLTGANLTDADLTGADMRAGKIMQKANKGDLVTRIRVAAKGEKTILTGARLNNADMSGVRAGAADFTNADLTGALLQDAEFRSTNFEGANLNDTNFTGANLTYANMKDSILCGADMKNTEHFGLDLTNSITQADMGQTLGSVGKTLDKLLEDHTIWVETAGKGGKQLDLSGYDLRDIDDLRLYSLTAMRAVSACFLHLNLSNAALQSTVLDKSDFRDCNLNSADFRGARLKGVKMTRAHLQNAKLSPLEFKHKGQEKRINRVDLSGSDLRFANLENADLRDAILMGVDFTHADLSGADLRRADFTGAIFLDTRFNGANLEGAIIDFGSL